MALHKNGAGDDTLHTLCRSGNLEKIAGFVERLSEHQLEDKLSHKKGVFGYTLLHESVASGKSEVLNYLLSKSPNALDRPEAPVNSKANSGYTPLHLAASNGYMNCVEVLVKHNANISVTDDYGKTPKETAKMNSKSDISNLLHGEEIIKEVRTNGDNLSALLRFQLDKLVPGCLDRALLIATQNDNHSHIAKLLLKGAANLEECLKVAKDENKPHSRAMLLLIKAAQTGNGPLIKKLYGEPCLSLKNCRDYADENFKSVQVAVRKVSTVIPMEIARLSIQPAVREQLLMKTDVYEKSGCVYWHGLQLLKLESSWLQKIHWVKELKLATNGFRRLPLEVGTYLKQVTILDLQNNELTAIPACLLELPSMEDLNLCYNKLVSFPNVPQCSASLKKLDLSRNLLCTIPPSVVIPSITTLNISHNQFRVVPMCICSFTALRYLDISENPDIISLPPELARLSQLYELKLDGLNSLNDPPKSVMKDFVDTMNYLKSKLEGAKEFYRMKLMLIGYANRGKSTLVARLQGNDRGDESTVGVDISEWSLKVSLGKKPFYFSIWDFGGQEEYYATHQCFLSQNSLYLLLFDITDGEKGIQELKPWLNNISLRAPHSRVIIVGTHLDEIEEKDRGNIDDLLQEAEKLGLAYRKKLEIVDVIPVGLKNRIENIGALKEAIYNHAAEYRMLGGTGPLIMGRKIPASYLALDKQLEMIQDEVRQGLHKPVMQEEEFKRMVEDMSLPDIQTLDEIKTAVLFLSDIGSLLHFDDRGHNLHDLYFVDPRWLCDMMSKVVTVKERNPFIKQGLLYSKDIPMLFKTHQFPWEIFEQYLALLDRFEIALPLDNKRVLIPSMLPNERPSNSLDCLYTMPAQLSYYTQYIVFPADYTPPGLWSRIISRIMHFIPQVSYALDKVQPSNLLYDSLMYSSYEMSTMYSVRQLSTSSESERITSIDGSKSQSSASLSGSYSQSIPRSKEMKQLPQGTVHISSPTQHVDPLPPNIPKLLPTQLAPSSQPSVTDINLEYWHTGVYYEDTTVTFCIEALDKRDEQLNSEGIVILSSKNVTGKEVICQLVELVTSLIENWYPGLKNAQHKSPCKECMRLHHKQPYMFSHDHCLTTIMEGKKVVRCRYDKTDPSQNHTVKLADLAPDLLIEGKFLLQPKDITYNASSVLGEGGFGKVFKGKCRGRAVAIKTYNKRDHSGQSKESDSKDRSKQFKELHSEAKLLLKLHHPCLVCMVGICVHPDVMALVLEEAPFRSLDSVILDKQPPFTHRITIYRIAAEVAAALHFLHRQGIIFRDLKANNVLLWTLDHKSLCHCKVTDFGIATYKCIVGVKGKVEGTKGFTAPEMLYISKRTQHSMYDHRVDIFSYGMFLYQLIARRNPYHDVAQIRVNELVVSGEMPRLRDVHEAHTSYCFLTEIMKNCWENDPEDRPSTHDIIKKTCLSSIQSIKCVHPIKNEYSMRHSLVVTAAQLKQVNILHQSHSELWLCCDGIEGTQISVYNTHTMVKINQNFISDNQILCVALCGNHIWVSSRAGIGNGSLDIFDITTHELLHNINIKENSVFCIASSPSTIYLGTVEGYCFCFPNDLEKIRTATRPKVRYVSEHTLDGIVCTKQCVWVSTTKFLYFLEFENLTIEECAHRQEDSVSFIGKLSLSPDESIVWSAHLGGSLLTAWDAQSRTHMYDVNVSVNLRRNADIEDEQAAIITAMTPALDTVWVGTASGHIMVFHQEELLAWYQPYKEYVRFLTPISGSVPNEKEDECVIVSGGKKYQAPVEGLHHSQSMAEQGELNNSIGVVILWEVFKSETLKQVKMIETNSPQYLENHTTIKEMMTIGKFKDGTQILEPVEKHDTKHMDTTSDSADEDTASLNIDIDALESESETHIAISTTDTNTSTSSDSHTDSSEEDMMASQCIVKRPTFRQKRSTSQEQLDVMLPDKKQNVRITCPKPVRLEYLLNELQMDVTLAENEHQLEYSTQDKSHHIQIKTQNQLDSFLVLGERPQLRLIRKQ